jgi:hypothetical protein
VEWPLDHPDVEGRVFGEGRSPPLVDEPLHGSAS